MHVLCVNKINHIKTYLLFRRRLRRQGIALMKIPAYSLIENFWSLVKCKLHKHYLELYLMRGSVNEVKNSNRGDILIVRNF